MLPTRSGSTIRFRLDPFGGGRLALLAVALWSALGVDAAVAGVPFVQDQSALDLAFAADITAEARAADFVLAVETRIDFADLWLLDDPLDPNDNGTLDAYSGTLGWAILSDVGGAPGALLHSGGDVALALFDTGLDSQGADILRARLSFGEPLTLATGTYWLALDEGGWGTAGDGTSVSWLASSVILGHLSMKATPDSVPSDWLAESFETAFVLYGAPTTWNQSDVQTAQGGLLDSSSVWAANFDLAQDTALSRFETWFNDNNGADDGIFQNFSGTIGWGVYGNASPCESVTTFSTADLLIATNCPGTLICSGEDSAPLIFDTGILAGGMWELFRVRSRIVGCPILSPGRYWLAIREGAWGSPPDPDEIFIQRTVSFHNPPSYYSASVESPGGWTFGNPTDTPFVLLDDLLFAAGFEAGATCAWSSSAGGVCP